MKTQQDIFSTLGLAADQPGGCLSSGTWTSTTSAGVVKSCNPATGEILARVYGCADADYEALVAGLETVQASWRMVPAPKRGEIVRLIGGALREKKDALGTLVSLEVGKIKSEGDGEVQEMIDMADFAVGLSRMLYGRTMHSERMRHRMYEQWHPLGIVAWIADHSRPRIILG